MRHKFSQGKLPVLVEVWSLAEAYGSRTHPRPLRRPRDRFEDGEAHRDPYTSVEQGSARDRGALLIILCHSLAARVNSAAQLASLRAARFPGRAP